MAEIEFREDTTIYPVLIALADCLEAELAASGLEETPNRGPWGGAGVAFDMNDDECAQSWVQVTSGGVSTNFPEPDQSSVGATLQLAYVVEVGIIRCVATLDDSNEAPDMATRLNEVRVQMADMSAIRRAICKCLVQQDRDFSLGAYVPYGEGGVAGGSWTVTVKSPGNGG